MSSYPTKNLGFTIVEFMIATSVFSVVLLTVSAAIVHMKQSYQHGIYRSSTQAATSNLVDTLSQSLKFSGTGEIYATTGTAPDITYTRCVGNRQFLYVLGRQIGGRNPATSTRHAVVTRVNDSGCLIEPITASTPTGQPQELLGKYMRLVDLSIVPVGTMHKVTARVIYGDDDVLCSPSVANSCTDPLVTLSAPQIKTLRDLQCKSGAGSEFCAMSELSNTVYRRL